MRSLYARITSCWIALGLSISLGPGMALAKKAMPTAMLPIEPAAEDQELFENQEAVVNPVEVEAARSQRASGSSSMERRSTAVRAGLQMVRDGFGAQLQVLEYTAPWLAVSQSLRYQSQEQPDALFDRQYGLMLGLVLHPWRTARLSPLLSLQAGGDRYFGRSEEEEPARDLFGMEAALGLELKLARAASFVFQWTELYYPGLEEPLFPDQKPKTAYAGNFQVFFNLKWEGIL